MRRAGSGIFANPVLVGAVTVLVVLVAVFLAYNANNGLPFVPTQQLNVRIASGANLVRGNEVRSGGFRIGVVEDMVPVQLPSGQVGAELKLKLDKTIGDIPRDTVFRIRPRSALGLKYVELIEGKSKQVYTDGDTVPESQGDVPVDLDEVFELFDRKTRDASRQNLRGFGDAFAGRGRSIQQTLDELPDLLRGLEPVMRNLSAPAIELDEFFKELGDAARIVAPVSRTQADLFTSMADTFEALARDEGALKEFISKSPPTMDEAIASFREQRPFLTDLAAFSEDFRGATRELRAGLPTINSALETGTPVQRRAVELNDELGGAMDALRDLVDAPATNAALRGLTATVTTLNPQLRFYGPYFTVCNYWTYFWAFAAEHFSEPDVTGGAQRALLNSTGRQDDSLGSMGANAPANGEGVLEGTPQYQHGQDYPRAVNSEGLADCESGQRGYLHRQAKNFDKKFRIARDPRNPGLQGPTYAGRPSVPAGQTFTDLPETGPYADFPESEHGGR